METPADVPMVTDSSESDDSSVIEVLQFLLPGLCHLSSEDKARAVLIQHNAHKLMGAYFTYHWKQFHDDQVSESEVWLFSWIQAILYIENVDLNLSNQLILNFLSKDFRLDLLAHLKDELLV